MIMNAEAARHLRMWKVSNVRHVSECYRFNIITQTDRPLIAFGYKTEADAKAAATAIQSAIENAILVHPSGH
jgi:hypothetical protein